LLAGWAIMHGQTAADPAQPAAPAAQRRDYKIYRLRYATAAEAGRIVRQLLGAPDGRSSRLTMAADERTNSVLVLAPAAVQEEVEAILAKIDVLGRSGSVMADNAMLKTFTLKYATPDGALERALGMLLKDRPSARVTVLRDNRVVVVYGDPETMVKVKELLMQLESAAAAQEKAAVGRPQRGQEKKMVAIPIGHVEPDAALEDALRLMFLGTGARYVLLRNLGLLVVSADSKTIDGVQQFLSGISNVSSAASHRPPAADLQVRLYWVVSGSPRDEGSALPDSLEPVASELKGLGIERPRVAALLSLATTAQARFETSGRTNVDAAYRLSLTGTLSDGMAESALEIAVTRDAPGRGSGSVCSLRTRLRLPLDQPVIIGSAPAGTLKTAFVVEVRHPRPAAARGLTMEFRNKPWKQVLEWLADTTEMPVIASFTPAGTFTFIPPKAGQRFTIPEVIDILNEGLAGHHSLLVRRNRSFVLISTGMLPAPDGHSFLSLRIEDLAGHGRTELAQVIIPLRRLVAADVVPELKKLLGPHGEVVAIGSTNALVLLDTVGNIRRIYSLIQELERGAKEGDGKPKKGLPKSAPLKRPQ
jgi:type II secretory pathway component GspD/PulD (secretin)